MVTQLVKNLQCRRPWFNSWVRKIPWGRDMLLTPVFLGFPGGSDGKESACNVGDLGSIPGLGRGRHGNPPQYSCLENPHGQRSLASCSPWSQKDWETKHSTHMYTPHFVYLLIHHWMSGLFSPGFFSLIFKININGRPEYQSWLCHLHRNWLSHIEFPLCISIFSFVKWK